MIVRCAKCRYIQSNVGPCRVCGHYLATYLADFLGAYLPIKEDE